MWFYFSPYAWNVKSININFPLLPWFWVIICYFQNELMWNHWNYMNQEWRDIHDKELKLRHNFGNCWKLLLDVNFPWTWNSRREFTNPLSNLSFLEVCLHLRPCTVGLFWLENPKNNSEKIDFFSYQKNSHYSKLQTICYVGGISVTWLKFSLQTSWIFW